MHRELKYSYKKMSKINIKANTEANNIKKITFV